MRKALLGLIAAVALSACGGSETRYVTVTGSTADTRSTGSTTTSGVGGVTHRFASFRSPSGNIGCFMDRSQVRCDIRDRAWEPPTRPTDCELDYGQGIALGVTGNAELVCAGDTAIDPRAPVLEYGERSVAGALECLSEVRGMTCESSQSGQGFFLSRERYRLL
jgi:hypothetical protein